jgi:integrase
MTRASGHTRLVERKRGSVWYLRYRHPSGKQVQQLLGPAWTERSKPAKGLYTAKTANDALVAVLTDIRRGEIPDPGDTSGKTFEDAVEAWLRYVEHEQERPCKASTVRDYRSTAGMLISEFGRDAAIEDVDAERIEEFRRKQLGNEKLSRRTVQKQLVVLSGILKRAKKLGWIQSNPVEDVERVKVRPSGEFNVLSVEQVEAVGRKAEGMFQAAIIVAAYTGLRTGELRALRWRDVDFQSATIVVCRNKPAGGGEDTPKSGRVRSVPLMDDAARALDALSRREAFTGPDDRAFPDEAGGMLGVDAFRDALYAALKAAEIDRRTFPAGPFRFHDLRHTFGTLAVKAFQLNEVQAYMGHADISTTMRYVHHVPKVNAARRFTEAIERERAGDLDDVSRNVSRTAPNQPKPGETTGTGED